MISERTPEPHGTIHESGFLFLDLESLVDDYLTALDSLLLACEYDDMLRATVIRNWRATSWEVRWFTFGVGPPMPGTATPIPQTVSASATSSATFPDA